MDNMKQNLLKYTIGIVVFLTVLALYFFFMMSKNLTYEKKSGSVVQEAISTQEQQQCVDIADGAELSDLQQTLSRARDESIACSASLNDSAQDIAKLKSQLKNMQTPQVDYNQGQLQIELQEAIDNQSQLQNELQAAVDNVDVLQVKIETLEAEKQQLLSASDSGGSQEEAIAKIQTDLATKSTENRELASNIKSLQRRLADSEKRLEERQDIESKFGAELAKINQDKIQLLAKISDLEATKSETSISTSGPLEIVKFETLPVFCEQHLSASQICISSIEIVTSFSFRPNGSISLRLRDPDGDTIERKSIAAQEINLYSFAFDDEIFAAGEYIVEIKIDDVFNRFSSEQRFTLSLPLALQDKLNAQQ
jgi:preprotein translocase subunit SecF